VAHILESPAIRQLLVDEPALATRLATRIIPAIDRYASSAAVVEAHRAGVPARTTMSRANAAGLVARMFRGEIEPTAAPLLATTYPQELAKLRCMLAYFDRIFDAPPAGTFEVERVVVDAHAWESDPSPLAPFTIEPAGAIEDAEGCIQIDFANRYLGGGVITGGCVQEEIRFAVSPELLAAMTISPRMIEREAIVMRGAERFATTRGYAFDLRFGGDFVDRCARLPDGTPDVVVSAIDAIDYRKHGVETQYEPTAIRRELDKARAGFRRDAARRPIATGNWGCGVFGGDPMQKAAIQWLAASVEGRAIRYFTFGDRRLGGLADFIARARAELGTVGALYTRLVDRHS
jgi:poly(ADP-ribose) glycohydrolase